MGYRLLGTVRYYKIGLCNERNIVKTAAYYSILISFVHFRNHKNIKNLCYLGLGVSEVGRMQEEDYHHHE